jgi:hypothetical protein
MVLFLSSSQPPPPEQPTASEHVEGFALEGVAIGSHAFAPLDA